MAIVLPATVTLAQATSVLRTIEAAPPSAGGDVEIDAGALRACDSAALAVLLEAGRIATRRGGRLRVSGAPSQLAALAALYGVDGLLALSAASTEADSSSRADPT